MTTTATPRLSFDSISKSFSGVHALREVSFDVHAGEVLALMGENGAGKSTLLRVLSGAHAPDHGRLLIDGQPVSFAGPRDSQRAGLRVIQQEPEIVPHVSVAENVYLGALPKRGFLVDRARLAAQVRADLDEYGFTGSVDPDMLGSELSAAQRQLVEILRALASKVRIIAFDEPTSSLSDHEVEALFGLIRRLRADGVAIIYVSHRMSEIFSIADRVAVLRDGAYVGDRKVGETDNTELVRMMVGRDLADMLVREPAEPGDTVLAVEHLTNEHVTDVTLHVRSGEVLGIGGLVGAGRSELAHAIVGADRITSGSVSLGGRPLRLRGPADALRAGIGFAPEERKEQALLLRRSVRDNISLAVLRRLTRLHVVRRRDERAIAREYVDRLSIRTPTIEQEVGNLSGGNQQKVVLARWLARQPKALILDEPTRGVDVGAKAEIYAIISQLAAQGVALVVISSELPELLGLADRIVVMREGRVSGELTREQATEERVLTLAMPDDQSESSPTTTAGATA